MIGNFPLKPFIMGVGFLLYGCMIWKYSYIYLLILPALLPVLDLAPWTGRFFFDEFDILILVTLAVRYWTLKDCVVQIKLPKLFCVLLYSFIISVCISTLIGLVPFPALDANSFVNYFSPYNALRVSKGFVWAILFVPLLKRDFVELKISSYIFIAGMWLGLAGVGIATLWERQIFPGLINFDSDFRLTATFSGMHTGGAYIDAYLSMVLPFSVACFLLYQKKSIQIFGIGLLGIGLYALLVTFSRIDYLSFLFSFLLISYGLFIYYTAARQRIVVFVLTCVVGVVLLGFISMGTFIQNRFSTVNEDFRTRIKHWEVTLQIRSDNLITDFFGMGLGSYPRVYASRSMENERSSSYLFEQEAQNTFLSLPSLGYLYMDQRIDITPDSEYLLKMDLRTVNKQAKLTSLVCEKTLLHSFRSKFMVQKIGNIGEWEHHEKQFNSGEVGKGSHFYQRRPVSLSLLNGLSGTFIDIDNVELLDAKGNNLIKNGDFSSGMDFWFFTADDHLPWHIKNLWIHLIFENGWIGFLIFNFLLLFFFVTLLKQAIAGDLEALIWLSSLCGVLVVGLVDSLFDFPRITFLFMLLILTGMLRRSPLNNTFKGNYK